MKLQAHTHWNNGISCCVLHTSWLIRKTLTFVGAKDDDESVVPVKLENQIPSRSTSEREIVSHTVRVFGWLGQSNYGNSWRQLASVRKRCHGGECNSLGAPIVRACTVDVCQPFTYKTSIAGNKIALEPKFVFLDSISRNVDQVLVLRNLANSRLLTNDYGPILYYSCMECSESKSNPIFISFTVHRKSPTQTASVWTTKVSNNADE